MRIGSAHNRSAKPFTGFGGGASQPPPSYSAPPPQNYGSSPSQQYGGAPSQQFGGTPSQQYGGTPSHPNGGPPSQQYGGPPPQQPGGAPTQQYGGPPPQQYGGPPSQGSPPEYGNGHPNGTQPVLGHNPYNTPIHIYSGENIADSYQAHADALAPELSRYLSLRKYLHLRTDSDNGFLGISGIYTPLRL